MRVAIPKTLYPKVAVLKAALEVILPALRPIKN